MTVLRARATAMPRWLMRAAAALVLPLASACGGAKDTRVTLRFWAFGLTMLTVVLTGLYVRSPSSRRAPDTPAVILSLGEPKTVNLVFAARAALGDDGHRPRTLSRNLHALSSPQEMSTMTPAGAWRSTQTSACARSLATIG